MDDHMKRQQVRGHLQMQERGIAGSHPTKALLLGFQPLEPWEISAFPTTWSGQTNPTGKYRITGFLMLHYSTWSSLVSIFWFLAILSPSPGCVCAYSHSFPLMHSFAHMLRFDHKICDLGGHDANPRAFTNSPRQIEDSSEERAKSVWVLWRISLSGNWHHPGSLTDLPILQPVHREPLTIFSWFKPHPVPPKTRSLSMPAQQHPLLFLNP